MAKNKIPPTHHQTKRQLSHYQAQHRRQNIILLVGTLVVLAVLILVGTGVYQGWYLAEYKPMHETVVEVNGRKFDMAYYLDTLNLQTGGQASADIIRIYFSMVLQGIEQAELLREGAAQLGYTVSEAEVDEFLEDAESYLKSIDVPVDSPAVRDAARTELLRGKLATEHFSKDVPTSAEQRHVLAMFLESQLQVEAVKARLLAGEDFATVAAELSLDSTTKSGKGDLGTHPQDIFKANLGSETAGPAFFSQPVGALGQLQDAEKYKQVGYWLVKVIEKKEDGSQVHLEGMLLGSEQQAQELKARLDAGEDFATLAQQYGQNWTETSKDDLGWISSDNSAAYTAYAFNTATVIGAVSAPIKDTGSSTKGGIWLFEVASSETADITTTDRDTLINQALQDWLTAAKENPATKITENFGTNQQSFAASHAHVAAG